MQPASVDTVSFMINRQKIHIPVDNIMYAAVEDKRCSLTLTHQQSLSFFMTIRSLKEQLPENRFIQISRSNLVSLQYIRRIDETDVILSDETKLPYSRRQKSSIVNALHHYLSAQNIAIDTSNWKSKIATEFQCLDHCPIPFFVTESIYNTNSHFYDAVICYANEAFAEQTGIALYRLIGQPLNHILKDEAAFLINTINNIALSGGTSNQPIKSVFSDIPLHYAAYRPHYGFCASILLPIRTDYEVFLPPPA